MSDNCCVCSWASWVRSFISDWWLNVTDCCTLWNLIHRQNISGGNSSFSSTKYILSSICTLSCEEILCLFFIFIWISEIDFDQWTPSSRVMEYSSHYTSNISLSLRKIEITISRRGYSFWLGGGINTTFFTFPLA